jgi:hypothetical protein
MSFMMKMFGKEVQKERCSIRYIVLKVCTCYLTVATIAHMPEESVPGNSIVAYWSTTNAQHFAGSSCPSIAIDSTALRRQFPPQHSN